MALFLLESKQAFDYDTADGFVVAAKDEAAARKLAAKRCGDEGEATWLDPKMSTCELLSASNGRTPKVILRSFRAG